MRLILVFLLCLQFAGAQHTVVPFVGCECDTQNNPEPAPRGAPKQTILKEQYAKGLAYFFARPGIGVLAPRGWKCRGFWGSGGYTLIIAPKEVVSSHDITGPVVRISVAPSDNSGRYDLANIVARVFPSYWDYSRELFKFMDWAESDHPFRPYPSDKMIYRGDRVVEFRTPPATAGLGTYFHLAKSETQPIDGVALLDVSKPHGYLTLVHVAVRLPKSLQDLTSAIILQAEADGLSR